MATQSAKGIGRRPTLRDVADRAGVSIQTVSNVTRRRFEQLRPETRARVEQAMREVGYHPNVAARGLRSAHVQAVGFLVLDEAPRFLADPLTDLLVAGVGDMARDADYGVLVQGERPLAEKRALVRPLLERRVDAAAVVMSGPPDLRAQYIESFRSTGAPFVIFDELLDDQEVLGVRTEERDSSRRLTRHLLSRGHERIAFIAARLPWSVVEQRHHGYRDVLEEAGIGPWPHLELFEASWQGEGGRVMAERLLGLDDPPTAIICGSDVLAIGAISAAKRSGRRVPDDVAIAGFDDFEFSEYVDPPLTTVRIPAYEMGQIAARMLISRVEGDLVDEPHVVLENSLIVRESA